MNDLRFEAVMELADMLASYSVSLGEAAHRQNAVSSRLYFEAIRKVGATLRETLDDIEAEMTGRDAA